MAPGGGACPRTHARSIGAIKLVFEKWTQDKLKESIAMGDTSPASRPPQTSRRYRRHITDEPSSADLSPLSTHRRAVLRFGGVCSYTINTSPARPVRRPLSRRYPSYTQNPHTSICRKKFQTVGTTSFPKKYLGHIWQCLSSVERDQRIVEATTKCSRRTWTRPTISQDCPTACQPTFPTNPATQTTMVKRNCGTGIIFMISFAC